MISLPIVAPAQACNAAQLLVLSCKILCREHNYPPFRIDVLNSLQNSEAGFPWKRALGAGLSLDIEPWYGQVLTSTPYREGPMFVGTFAAPGRKTVIAPKPDDR